MSSNEPDGAGPQEPESRMAGPRMAGPLEVTLFSERIATEQGENTTEFRLRVQPDGEVRVDGCYAGPSAKAFWGDWDHEFWLTIPPGHLPALLAAALRDGFSREGRLAWTDFVALLQEAGIPFSEGHWT